MGGGRWNGWAHNCFQFRQLRGGGGEVGEEPGAWCLKTLQSRHIKAFPCRLGRFHPVRSYISLSCRWFSETVVHRIQQNLRFEGLLLSGFGPRKTVDLFPCRKNPRTTAAPGPHVRAHGAALRAHRRPGPAGRRAEDHRGLPRGAVDHARDQTCQCLWWMTQCMQGGRNQPNSTKWRCYDCFNCFAWF